LLLVVAILHPQGLPHSQPPPLLLPPPVAYKTAQYSI
jgi:hypothetical protein